jgi:hypothetical protein
LGQTRHYINDVKPIPRHIYHIQPSQLSTMDFVAAYPPGMALEVSAEDAPILLEEQGFLVATLSQPTAASGAHFA